MLVSESFPLGSCRSCTQCSSERDPEIYQEVLGKVHYTEYLLSLGRKQERYTNGQKAQEKMLGIISHQRNGNQNHSEIPLHTYWDDDNKKGKK